LTFGLKHAFVSNPFANPTFPLNPSSGFETLLHLVELPCIVRLPYRITPYYYPSLEKEPFRLFVVRPQFVLFSRFVLRHLIR
jgi:hypothetical protein